MGRTQFEEVPAEVVQLRDVESTLTRMLQSTDDLIPGPIHRARMSNLVVFCDTIEKASEIEAIVPQIIEIHPARVILMVAVPGTDSSGLTTTVLVRRNIANHRQVSEQITLQAVGRSADHLPFALRELLIGDLPTNFWWATKTPPAIAGPLLYEFSEYAQQVLFDSYEWNDPHRGIATLDAWLARFDRTSDVQPCWRTASDLNWRRTRIWRRILAEGLSPTTAPGVLETIADVEIEHGCHAVTQAWGLAGWFAGRLGWSVRSHRLKLGEEISLQLTGPHGDVRLRLIRNVEGSPSIQRVRVACSGPDCKAALNFGVEDSARIVLTPEACDTAARTVAVGLRDLAEVVGRQLSDRVPDPIFREAMRHARILAHGFEF